VLLLLFGITAITVPVSLMFFAWFMKRARQSGLLDMTTGS
jgi:hypothetical protein